MLSAQSIEILSSTILYLKATCSFGIITRADVIELHERQSPTRLDTGASEVDEEEAASRTLEVARADSYRKKVSVLVSSGLVQLPIWGISTDDRSVK